MRLCNGSIPLSGRQGFPFLITGRCGRSRKSQRLTGGLGFTRKSWNWCFNDFAGSRILNLSGGGNISGWVGSMRISGKVLEAVPECSEGTRYQKKHGYRQSGNKIGLLPSPRLNLFGRALPSAWGKKWLYIYYAQYRREWFSRRFSP